MYMPWLCTCSEQLDGLYQTRRIGLHLHSHCQSWQLSAAGEFQCSAVVLPPQHHSKLSVMMCNRNVGSLIVLASWFIVYRVPNNIVNSLEH